MQSEKSSCLEAEFSQNTCCILLLRDSNKQHLPSVQAAAPGTQTLEGFHGNNQHPPATT